MNSFLIVFWIYNLIIGYLYKINIKEVFCLLCIKNDKMYECCKCVSFFWFVDYVIEGVFN